MILIGQYDSPFVRRVGIALHLYGLAFEHRPWSVFSDGAKVRALNPLMRVPVLVTPQNIALTDSHMILDYLDHLVQDPMFPRSEPDRHHALRIATLACGLAEKAVSLFYERRLHTVTSATWEERCITQITSIVTALNTERPATMWWFGDHIGHADIALACALRFITDAHPGLIDLAKFPTLQSHSQKAEALPVFQTVHQAFVPPG